MQRLVPARYSSPRSKDPRGCPNGYGWNVVRTDRNTRMLAHTGQDDLIRHISYLYAFPDEGVVVILLADAPLSLSNETLRGMIGILFPD